MKVFYDTGDNNQVQALYSEECTSTVWDTFASIVTTDPVLISELMLHGRDCRVTVVSGVLTVVTAFDHPVDHSLAVHKAERIALVDYMSGVLIVGYGITYDAKVFSLSAMAQMNWTNLYQNRANWVYPRKASLKDNVSEYSFADQAAVEAFYAAVIVRIADEVLDPGRQLRIDIDAAVDQAALDAITDTRA